MYSISTSLTNILKQPARIFDVKFTYGSYTITTASIGKFSISHALTDDKSYSFGNAVYKEIEIELYKTDEVPSNWTNYQLEFFIGVCSQEGVTNPEQATEWTWIPMGKFNIDASGVSEENNVITLKGKDKLSDFSNTAFAATGTYTSTDAILTAIVNQTGYTVNYPTNRSDFEYTIESTSVRNVLQFVAQMLGKNVWIDRNDAINFISPTQTSFEITADNYKTLKFKDTKVQTLSKLEITTNIQDEESEEQVSWKCGTTAGSTYSFENNAVTSQAIADGIYTRSLLPFSYRGYELSAQGFPQIDVGDIIKVTDVDNNEYNLPVLGYTLEYDGTLTMTMEADVYSNNTVTFSSSTGSITGSIAKLEYDSVVTNNILANKIIADEAEFNKLEAEDATINGKLTADEANITDLQAKNVEIEGKITAAEGKIETLETTSLKSTDITAEGGTFHYLDADVLETEYADIDFANITEIEITETAWVKDLLVQGKIVSQDEASIYYLESIHIDANDITAGTLTADRLLLQGEDGLYYQLNANALNITASELGDMYILTEDTTPVEDKIYYTYNSETSEYEEVAIAATDNPKELGYYEENEEVTKYYKKIHASNIMANTITVEHITTEDLIGDSGWINLHTGEFAYGNSGETNGYISFQDGKLTIIGDLSVLSNSGEAKSVNEAMEKADALDEDVRSYMTFDSDGLTIYKENSSSEVAVKTLYANDGMHIKILDNEQASFTQYGAKVPQLLIDDDMSDDELGWHISENITNHLTFSKKI